MTPEVAPDAGAALGAWGGAPLVLVGADLADEVARIAPARRGGVHVVAWGAVPDELFRTALAIGAENVAELPKSEAWVVELLTDVGDAGRARGLTVGVVGGCGGAGCDHLRLRARADGGPQRAGGASSTPTRSGPASTGCSGSRPCEGVRWDALCQTTGRLSARSLREALPAATTGWAS